MLDNLKTFFKENPQYFGLLFIAFGIIMLISSIKGSKWLFEKDVSTLTYNVNKIDGLINLFGKKTARIIVAVSSIVVILSGILWFWIYAYYY